MLWMHSSMLAAASLMFSCAKQPNQPFGTLFTNALPTQQVLDNYGTQPFSPPTLANGQVAMAIAGVRTSNDWVVVDVVLCSDSLKPIQAAAAFLEGKWASGQADAVFVFDRGLPTTEPITRPPPNGAGGQKVVPMIHDIPPGPCGTRRVMMVPYGKLKRAKLTDYEVRIRNDAKLPTYVVPVTEASVGKVSSDK